MVKKTDVQKQRDGSDWSWLILIVIIIGVVFVALKVSGHF